MNAPQRWCLGLSVLLAAIVFMIPPWQIGVERYTNRPGSTTLWLRYERPLAPRYLPPQPHLVVRVGSDSVEELLDSRTIDLRRLLVAFTAMAVGLFAGLLWFCKRPEATRRQLVAYLLAQVVWLVVVDVSFRALEPGLDKYLRDRTWRSYYEHR